jgi:hypothetical protein
VTFAQLRGGGVHRRVFYADGPAVFELQVNSVIDRIELRQVAGAAQGRHERDPADQRRELRVQRGLEVIGVILLLAGIADLHLDRHHRRRLAGAAGHADGLVGGELATLLGERAEFEAGRQIGDDAVDSPAAHRQGDRAFVVERVPEAEDAVADHLSAGADRGEFGIPGQKRNGQNRSRLELGRRLLGDAGPARARLQRHQAAGPERRSELLEQLRR